MLRTTDYHSDEDLQTGFSANERRAGSYKLLSVFFFLKKKLIIFHKGVYGFKEHRKRDKLKMEEFRHSCEAINSIP